MRLNLQLTKPSCLAIRHYKAMSVPFIVWCPDPALRREKDLVTIEHCLAQCGVHVTIDHVMPREKDAELWRAVSAC